MKTAIASAALVSTLCGTAFGAYQPQSRFLTEPSNNIDIIVSIADFWAHAKDDTNGGFYTFVDLEGNPVPNSWCEPGYEYAPKSVVGQSRAAYAFVRAFQVTGNEGYLDLARHALSFLYSKGWNETTGGWWFSTDDAGNRVPCRGWDPNQSKWTYAQMYPLIGISAVLEATEGKPLGPESPPSAGSDRDWFLKGMALLNDHVWDDRPGYLGYYHDADYDWLNPRNKGFTGTVDGITTHAAAASRLLHTPNASQRFLDLAGIADERLVGQMDNPNVKIGFPASYDSDWNLDANSTTADVGLALKTGWILGRAFLSSPFTAWQEGARKAMRNVLDRGGYDFEHGGPYALYDWSTGAITHGKIYWMVEQAVTLGLLNARIALLESDRNDGLRIADQSIDFFDRYMMDWTYGGYFFETDDAGTVTNSTKGDIFEQGYHGSELAYFAYLYGHVFLTRSEFSLYYRLAPSERPRVVRLEPAELGQDAIRIAKVTQDRRRFRGLAFGLNLLVPAGAGGVFKVTFAPRP